MKLFSFFIAAWISHSTFAQRTHQLAKVDSILHVFEQPGAPGLSIGIVENGQLIYARGIGFADIGKQVQNTDSTIFGIASVAKQFTAACIWSLVKEGKISLDDDVRKYITELPFYGKIIRVRHMLNHTSGIRNYHALMDLAGFDYDKSYHDNRTILELACRQKALNHPPGEKVIYGNTAYTLLAILVERVSGKNLDQYAKEKIFQPLGMNRTFYRVDTTTFIPNKSNGYVPNDDGGYTHPESNQLTYGAGSVGSSVQDLAIWTNVLNGLNPGYRDLTEFLTAAEQLPSGEPATYARGVMVDSYRDVKTIHHSGYGLGGQSQVVAIPDLKLAIIILTNLGSINPSPLSYTILDVFLPVGKTESPVSSTGFHHESSELTAFTGQYQEQHSDMKMEIFLEHDTLKALGNQGKKPIPLRATQKGKFTRLNNPAVRYDFIPAKNTGADLVVYFGGAPFYFSRARFIDSNTIDLSDFTGFYFSEELNARYEIYLEKDQLFVRYPNHHVTKLIPGQKDEFGNGQRVLYRFKRDQKNEVKTMYLSAEGTVRNIACKRIANRRNFR